MKPAYTYVIEEPKPLTLAELCEALAEGNLPSQQEGGYYTVRQRDLLRFARQSQVVNFPIAARARAAAEIAVAS